MRDNTFQPNSHAALCRQLGGYKLRRSRQRDKSRKKTSEVVTHYLVVVVDIFVDVVQVKLVHFA